MKRLYVLLGVLTCTCIETFGVKLNYDAMITRSDPWGYVNQIPRNKPNEFWQSLLSNNKQYLNLKEKIDHPTKLYLQAANDYAYNRKRGIQYYSTRIQLARS